MLFEIVNNNKRDTNMSLKKKTFSFSIFLCWGCLCVSLSLSYVTWEAELVALLLVSLLSFSSGFSSNLHVRKYQIDLPFCTSISGPVHGQKSLNKFCEVRKEILRILSTDDEAEEENLREEEEDNQTSG
jgi:hypothetical protein